MAIASKTPPNAGRKDYREGGPLIVQRSVPRI
jgi:hypothetical protein